ncbi:hypothetical protein BDV24DRAFT_163043 [Aspergillus arachidicola]|uniref:Uncharacterized protein n=1 Tax=Aspergillus arachidicola TaxID=656916 RepID=A0A5N6YBK5_9EURO|nr:hypothetical protein BDV24DRAFT_163043 [Aspergillus arachidicola]
MNFVELSDSMARLLTAVNSVTYLICTCCAVRLIERMGRRGLMMLSTAGQFFAFLIITILLRYAEANAGTVEGHRFGSASIMFFFLFYVFFGLANRTLEDIDTYYHSNPSIVIKDPDAISVKRPLKYIEHVDHEMKKIGEIRTKKADDLTVEHVE